MRRPLDHAGRSPSSEEIVRPTLAAARAQGLVAEKRGWLGASNLIEREPASQQVTLAEVRGEIVRQRMARHVRRSSRGVSNGDPLPRVPGLRRRAGRLEARGAWSQRPHPCETGSRVRWSNAVREPRSPPSRRLRRGTSNAGAAGTRAGRQWRGPRRIDVISSVEIAKRGVVQCAAHQLFGPGARAHLHRGRVARVRLYRWSRGGPGVRVRWDPGPLRMHGGHGRGRCPGERRGP